MTVDAAPILLWFRSDLRLHDHTGVAEAIKSGQPILPVYVYDEHLATRPLGAASRWWLGRSLHKLDEDLHKFGSRLIIAKGRSQVLIPSIAHKNDLKTVICSHTFDPVTEDLDKEVEAALSDLKIVFKRHVTGHLTTPGHLQTKAGNGFRVFTPFFKALEADGALNVDFLPSLSTYQWPSPKYWPDSLTVSDLKLDSHTTRSGHDWAAGFAHTPGEAGARGALRHFLKNGLGDYAAGRDRPDLQMTSYLSPHLRFGEISPHRVIHEVDRAANGHAALSQGAAKFRAEMAWREFNYTLLAQAPRLDRQNFRRDFDHFPWRDDDTGFDAWRRGETGYDMVDAGMRELWTTGIMHNRVRMITASFLVKHLLIDWRRGEQWFWDCLLDADPASNPANWQWVAGCGADAAPYFRVFNPITQAEKFDPDGIYRKKYIQASPLNFPKDIHRRQVGKGSDKSTHLPKSATYPAPIVEHAFARQRALDAFKERTEDHYE